ncbi:MAG: hypothetical protein J0I40_02930 [Cellulomonas sp.]|nr:hypothetical protein [Cellulomonas sp.]
MDQPIRAAAVLRIDAETEARGAVMRRAAGRGDLRRVRRGVYVGADHWQGIEPRQRNLIEIRAAIDATRSPSLVSHRSAAALWGLPVVGAGGTEVHLTVTGDSGPDNRRTYVRHAVAGPVPASEIDGIPVTSAARTVVDLARTDGFLTGAAAGDAALHRGAVTPDELQAALAAVGRGRGIRMARDVVAFVDGRSESAGESLSRVRMRELGVPAPDLQHVVRDDQGFGGRVDFGWEGLGVVGEFDGRSKYGIDEADRSASDQLWEEKLREDRLRALGLTVVRWTWSDAWLGGPMLARLHTAGVGRMRRAPTS